MNELVKGTLDVIETLRVRGGGLSEISGPTKLNQFVWFGPRTADPDTTLWSATEAGRTWYNSTSNKLKFWDGTTIRTVTST